jgi:hypothetical protein
MPELRELSNTARDLPEQWCAIHGATMPEFAGQLVAWVHETKVDLICRVEG